MKNYKQEIFLGALIGILSPFVAFSLSAFFVFSKSLSDFIEYLFFGNIFTHYLSLMMLFNALLFFVFIKRKEYVSRGILLSTFLYAFAIFIIKFSS